MAQLHDKLLKNYTSIEICLSPIQMKKINKERNTIKVQVDRR